MSFRNLIGLVFFGQVSYLKLHFHFKSKLGPILFHEVTVSFSFPLVICKQMLLANNVSFAEAFALGGMWNSGVYRCNPNSHCMTSRFEKQVNENEKKVNYFCHSCIEVLLKCWEIEPEGNIMYKCLFCYYWTNLITLFWLYPRRNFQNIIIWVYYFFLLYGQANEV